MSFEKPGQDPLTMIELMVWQESVKWHFARSMSYNPHWYCLRKEQSYDMFIRVVRHMREYGYWGRWGGRSWLYYDIGDWTLWSMGATLEETILINRKRREDI